MKESFQDILGMADVAGIMVFSINGELLYKEFSSPLPEEPEKKDWWGLFIASLNGIREADLVFERNRLYIRKTDLGYLMILMGIFAPVAMVRLNCDILLPSLKQPKAARGLGGLFKKKK